MKKIKLEKYDVNLFKLIFPRVDYDSIVFINTIEEIMCVRDACNEFLDHNKDKLEKVSDEEVEKTCDSCVDSKLDIAYLPCRECMNRDKWQPKEAKEKPKKYKYVCKACGARNCKLKIYGTIDSLLITNCPISGYAKWVKVVK